MTDPSKVLKRHRTALLWSFVFGFFANLLFLTGPLFMLQVYDRVLSSRSEATLLVLFALVVVLYTALGLLDYVRGRIHARIGADLDERLGEDAFLAMLTAPKSASKKATSGLQDVEAVRAFWASPAVMALMDVPWTPLFIAALFLFHQYMGWFAIIAGLLLALVALANQFMGKKPNENASAQAISAARLAAQVRSHPETIQGLGMATVSQRRWAKKRSEMRDTLMVFGDRNGGFGSGTKAIRLLLQSTMLALGAWLVLKNELTPGAMIAGSILLGRALSPVEQLIGTWAVVARARSGWASLKELSKQIPEKIERTVLPKPKPVLDLVNVSAIPEGAEHPVLERVSFRLSSGQALGVIGNSASGKTSLARLLVGLWLPSTGEIRLGGNALGNYDVDTRSQYIGYLPQEVVLFDGSVSENIARMSEEPAPEIVVAAARNADAYEMIMGLPEGFDTQVGPSGVQLSGGQKQRIGLARAVFGNPMLLVLDEPNSNLDGNGSDAVNAAVRRFRKSGRIVVLMTHRPSGIAECSDLLVLDRGVVRNFGKPNEVLTGQKNKPSKEENIPEKTRVAYEH